MGTSVISCFKTIKELQEDALKDESIMVLPFNKKLAFIINMYTAD